MSNTSTGWDHVAARGRLVDLACLMAGVVAAGLLCGAVVGASLVGGAPHFRTAAAEPAAVLPAGR